MAESPVPVPAITPPKQISRHVFAVLALLALGAAVGLWYLFNQTAKETLKLGAGMELKYRAGLSDLLCEEAKSRDLTIEVQWNRQAVELVQQVSKHDLDAAIIPAGLSISAENVQQVTMLDCETLHLFVKPELYEQGIAGLRGHYDLHGRRGHRGTVRGRANSQVHWSHRRQGLSSSIHAPTRK